MVNNTNQTNNKKLYNIYTIDEETKNTITETSVKLISILDYIIKGLKKSFHNSPSDYCSYYGNFFPITDEKVNRFLLANIPIYTSENPVYKIENSYRIVWNWISQVFYVSA